MNTTLHSYIVTLGKRNTATVIIVALVAFITSCSNGSNTQEINIDTTARSAINNDFYLKDQFEYGADGS